MPQTDDVERYPFGAPIRPEPANPAGEWRALDPSKPWIETNTKTGQMRNIKPEPPAPRYPWFGINGAESI